MKTNIVYFSRTSKTKAIAEDLGRKLDAKVFRITDDRNWRGPIGIIKGVIASAKDIRVGINVDYTAAKADRLIILSPLWLKGPTPAVKTFMDKLKGQEVHLVMINQASPIDRELKRTSEEYTCVKHTYGITHRKKNQDQVVDKVLAAM